jgi:hypothetical protein
MEDKAFALVAALLVYNLILVIQATRRATTLSDKAFVGGDELDCRARHCWSACGNGAVA